MRLDWRMHALGFAPCAPAARAGTALPQHPVAATPGMRAPAPSMAPSRHHDKATARAAVQRTTRATTFAGVIGDIMKYLAGSVLGSIAFMSAAQATAPAGTAEHAYNNAVLAPVTAARCADAIPGFEKTFEPAFASWKTRNASLIESGRDMRKATLKPGETIEAAERRLAGFVSIGLTTFAEADLRKRCEILLQDVGATTGQQQVIGE